MSSTDQQTSGAEVHASSSAPDQAARSGGRRVVRVVVTLLTLAVVALVAVELWAFQSYRMTVADLRSLQGSSRDDVTLEESQAVAKGWYTVENEEKSFREDVIIRWRSIYGDYWVRINGTKKSKLREKQLFTGFSTAGDKRGEIKPPEDWVEKPKYGPMGASAGGSKKRKKRKAKTDAAKSEKSESAKSADAKSESAKTKKTQDD